MDELDLDDIDAAIEDAEHLNMMGPGSGVFVRLHMAAKRMRDHLRTQPSTVDLYAHPSSDERCTLAVKARGTARSIALNASMFEGPRFDAAIEQSKRWQAIADELYPDTVEVTDDRK